MESRCHSIKFPLSKLRESNFKFLFSIFILVTILGACREEPKKDHASKETIKYTCPMHPNIMQEKPGVCPICGMNLVQTAKSNSSTNDLMLTDTQIKLANITTLPVMKKTVGQTLAINGRLSANEQKTQLISSRTSGRIEKLFFKETGESIQKGQPLYNLYSEFLLTLQQEYLLAKAQYATLGNTEKHYRSFLEGAEKKLLLYGLTKHQINQLADRNSLQTTITFLAPASGVITEINISEGQSVAEGSPLYEIEDITTLWVEAELYPSETSLINIGDKITVSVIGNDEQPIETTVSFLSPEYRSNSQISILRAVIKNPELKYKPGQQVQVYLVHSSKDAVAVPVDALVRDEHGAHLYVQAGRNTFRPRIVKTGLETFDQVEITAGINEGDTVAVSGAYLLYSAIILQNGTDPLASQRQ